jgi:YbbR domain-containing protein
VSEPVHKTLLHNWHLKLFSLLIAFLLWATYTAEPAAEIGYQAPIEFRNLPHNLEISGDVPSQVYVRVRGRSALLRRLSAQDLAILLDLAGSQPGEKLLRITSDNVDAPAGIEVVRISPAALRLRLVQRSTPSAP